MSAENDHTEKDDTVEDVGEYYSKLQPVFDFMMDTTKHNGIRYGYHDDDHEEINEAIPNMNRIMADRAEISEGDRVLDIGCGIGGSAVWLAETFDVEVVGINISELHLERARTFAEERGVDDVVEFRYDDFHDMETIDDDAFDVAWAIEAFCYAEDESAVLEQAARALKPGGRLVVSDVFSTDKERDMDIKRRMRKVRWGYNLPHLAKHSWFAEELDSVGYENVTVEDVTENAKPTSKYMRETALEHLDQQGIEPLLDQEAVLDIVLAGLYSYPMLEDGYAIYGHVTADIPE